MSTPNIKERPIIFSDEMVRATLDGRKTQTRRIVKHKPDKDCPYAENNVMAACPYGKPGDRLWVKETWKPDPSWGLTERTKPTEIEEGTHILYRATIGEHPKAHWQKWRSCLFMRRWMSRITLEIEAVRVERLQEITDEDAIAEGMPIDDAVHDYSVLWNSINGQGSWDANPFVWVVQFKRITP